MPGCLKLLPLAAWMALPLGAEFLSIEIAVSGLDCASCARSVDKVVRKIKGVESVAFRDREGIAAIHLKPGNTVSLDQVRDAMKQIGYTPRDAKVEARGSIVLDSGRWLFRLAGANRSYLVELPDESRKARGALIVDGIIPAPADRSASETLKISSFREDK